jgi:hypothetical protein
VNRAQKILTLLFLAAFVATLIWFPWGSGRYHNYYCVFLNYGQEPDWFRLSFEWIALVVIYVGLLAIFGKSDAKDTRKLSSSVNTLLLCGILGALILIWLHVKKPMNLPEPVSVEVSNEPLQVEIVR